MIRNRNIGRVSGCVDLHEVAGSAHNGSEGGKQIAQVSGKRARVGIRNLIVRISVSVRILLLERLEHVRQFLVCGGHVESQIVEPFLVDVHGRRYLGTQRKLFHQAVDLSVSVLGRRL